MEPKPSNFNLPNTLTVLRILLLPLLVYLLLVGHGGVDNRTDLKHTDYPTYLAAIILFAVLAFSDLFDGWYARKYNKITEFGKLWDPIADKLLVFSCYAVFCYILQVYFWWIFIPVFIMLLREIVVTIFRIYRIKKSKRVIAANFSGKTKTVVQLLSITSVILFPLMSLFNPVYALMLLIPYAILCYGLILLATFISVFSGVQILMTKTTHEQEND
ncbi:MAG: CDP-diacylglycerol--glycerol-3-phosphate 3-phosphatidyltransferase [Bifidobacteriaceae bacterium]|jgi:CDP-diacylglycerol--glycerol-3-phosphate 3-phosphatidyltransferase|nr:CDP-diacylglycerol--glycerol-3-phosphate 3-phosphatidyltransferase [Bifidobacteriaceae bacterium]